MQESGESDNTQSFSVVQAGARFSHYTIVSKVGAGGMGDVFLAQDVILNRNVVLKFLPPHLSADESFKSRFLREAKTAASLNHPNIITIYEIDESNGRLYIAMEEIRGESLKQYMARGGGDYLATLDIIVQVCRGLQVAHENGVVHRDIKPDNIMLTRGGTIKVLDFGLAKFQDEGDLTRVGTTLGTADYMSPEQGQGLDVDSRSDIFSLGIVLYEMLTGERAFSKETAVATMYSIVNEEHSKLCEVAPHLPLELQPIVDKCLAKDRSDRYQSTSEIILALNAVRGHSRIVPTHVTPAPAIDSQVKSLAVLCMTNLGSSEDEFLCYGISEDLIVDLTRIGSLRVAPMRSVLRFKDSDVDIAEIAQRLDVEFILDGSLLKSGDTVRVSVQLINAATGKNSWADRWESPADDLPSIKSDLCRGIGKALGLDEGKVDQSSATALEPAGARAYEFYIRGKYVFDHRKDTADIEVAVELYNRALSIDPSLILALSGLAETMIQKGEYERAVKTLTPAFDAAERDGRRIDAFRILVVLGEARIHLSNWDEATEILDRARVLADEQGNLAGEARALQLLIDVYQQRAQFDEALKLFERIMQITRELDDQAMAAESLKSIAGVHYRRGEYSRAMTLWEEAITIARRRENVLLEAKCICNIGLAKAITEETAASLELFDKALEMYTKIGDRTGQSNAYNNMALVHSSRGSYDKAIEFGQKAADLEKDLKETAGYALAICNVARYKAIIGDYKSAIQLANEALRVALDIDYPFVHNLANDSLGYCYYCDDDLTKALKYYKAALQVAEKSGLRREAALALSNLCEVSYGLNDIERSRDYAERALSLAAAVGGSIALIRASIYRALLADAEGESGASLEQAEKTLTKAREFGDPRFVITCLRILHEICTRDPECESLDRKGIDYLSEALALAEEKGIAHEIRLCRDAKEG